MSRISKILRHISLAVLFGGSSAVVFVAVILVKAATAQGVPVSEAAAINAPAFIEFSKVAAGAAIMLIAAEAMDFMSQGTGKRARSVLVRYVTSLLCAFAAFIFAFVIVPPMRDLQPQVKTDETKRAEFHKLHEVSRGVFGASILFALVSLVISAASGAGAGAPVAGKAE